MFAFAITECEHTLKASQEIVVNFTTNSFYTDFLNYIKLFDSKNIDGQIDAPYILLFKTLLLWLKRE